MDKELKNYYEVLEIPYDSTHEEIHSGYTRAKNAYSGESLALYSLMTEDECQGVLTLIEEAYSILSVPEKRKEYDRVKGIDQTQKSASREAPQGGIRVNVGAKTDFTHFGDSDDSFSPFPDIAPSNNTSQFGASFEGMTRTTLNSDVDRVKREAFLKEDFNLSNRDVFVSRVTAHNRYALSFQSESNFEEEIKSAKVFTGELLKKIREYKNVDLERMAEMTKVSKTYLRAIEAEDIEKLPAKVYVRGFVYQYAKCLKLNPDVVASSYVSQLKNIKK